MCLLAVLEIPPPINVKPGDQLRATATYVADSTQENAMHLVEGEKVYVKGQLTEKVSAILVSFTFNNTPSSEKRVHTD